jgi:dimethylamine--corrinoid protein Co-methyltransferase
MGSGFPVEMSESELMQDLTGGSEDAADRGKIPPLSEEELKYLFDLFSSTDCFLSVESGKEIVLSYDASPLKMIRTAVNVHRIQSLQIYEKLLGADTLELGHVDYSFKPVKPIVGTEQTVLEQTLMVTHPPLFYGAMPNLGLTRENALILALPNNLEVAHSHIRASQTVPHHFHDARRLRSDGAP